MPQWMTLSHPTAHDTLTMSTFLPRDCCRWTGGSPSHRCLRSPRSPCHHRTASRRRCSDQRRMWTARWCKWHLREKALRERVGELVGQEQSFLLRTLRVYCEQFFLKYWIQFIMPGWHSGIMRWLSSMLANTEAYSEVWFQPGTDNFVLSVCCRVWFLASLCYQDYSYTQMGS